MNAPLLSRENYLAAVAKERTRQLRLWRALTFIAAAVAALSWAAP